MANRIYQIYGELSQKHGDPARLWPQWCAKKKDGRLRETIALGAILTQRTSWHNADLALRNLKAQKLLSLAKIACLDSPDQLTALVKPAGFYQTKPKRLFEFARFIVNGYHSIENFSRERLAIAREKLLSLSGIGPETADDILLYALDKPSFVIDEYTRRLAVQRSMAKQMSYDHLKKLFEESLPGDVVIYQNYHALIVIDQKGKEASVMKVV